MYRKSRQPSRGLTAGGKLSLGPKAHERSPERSEGPRSSGSVNLRSGVVVTLWWRGGSEPWVEAAYPDGTKRKIRPAMAVWELVLNLKGWEDGRP